MPEFVDPTLALSAARDLRSFFPSQSAQPADCLPYIHAGLDWSALTGGVLVIPVTVEPLIVSSTIIPPVNSRMVGAAPVHFNERGSSGHGNTHFQLPALPNAIGEAWIKLADGANCPILAVDYNNAVGKRGPLRSGGRYCQWFSARDIVFDHNGRNQTGALVAVDIRNSWMVNLPNCRLVDPRGIGFLFDNCDSCDAEKLYAASTLENVATGTGAVTLGSPTITGATGVWARGDLIAGAGIPAGTFVDGVAGGAGNLTLTLAQTSGVGAPQNATLTNAAAALVKQTPISTNLLVLRNATVDSDFIGLSMHCAGGANVLLDSAVGCRLSGLTGYSPGGYNLQLSDTYAIGCIHNRLDLRLEQAGKHNARCDTGAANNTLELQAFNCGLYNLTADADGGWCNVFDDGQNNAITGAGGRGVGDISPSNNPIFVYGPNTLDSRQWMSGGKGLAAGTVYYRSRPVAANVPGAQRSSRHAILPDPFVIAPRALSGAEGTALTFAAFNGFHEVAVLPDGVTSTVVAYCTIPPGANSLRVQLALVNLNTGVAGNVRVQLGYGDTTEFGGTTPGTDEGAVQLQTIALAANAQERVAGFGADGGAVGFPGTITCGQWSWIRFKRIGADALDTLAADIGIRSILITPLLIA